MSNMDIEKKERISDGDEQNVTEVNLYRPYGNLLV